VRGIRSVYPGGFVGIRTPTSIHQIELQKESLITRYICVTLWQTGEQHTLVPSQVRQFKRMQN
jgi:hypothetical protein